MMLTRLLQAEPALLLVYVLASVAGLHLLKLSGGSLLSARFLCGLGLHACGFLIWYALLTRMPLSVAFPLAAGALMIGTQVSGYFFLEETLSGRHLVGVLMILTGLVMISPSPD
jgi:multidrug transporter EmrE-like cation transporter